MNFLIFVVTLAVGVVLIWKTEACVRITGEIGWAERNLGGAGTYSLYKIIGIALIIFGMMIVTGTFDAVFGGFLRTIFGGFASN